VRGQRDPRHLADGQVADWQVTVKIGFRLDDEE